ncbi:MAG TPA: methionine--tRNA ligase subunit beta [Phycisphaerae bacterium]|nr:methionine--tRNA ligase subunit beta [Phycisphaerae bacterium]
MPDAPEAIKFEDFAKIDMRVATITQAEAHPNADKLIVIQADLGGEQRQLIAGLRGHYEPQDLVGRQIIVVTNLPPRMMRGLESRAMLLAACTEDESRVICLSPERECPPGTRVL